jgi:hypothetical protein
MRLSYRAVGGRTLMSGPYIAVGECVFMVSGVRDPTFRGAW